MPRFRTLIAITTFVVLLVGYLLIVKWRAPETTSIVAPATNAEQTIDDRSAATAHRDGVYVVVQIYPPTVEGAIRGMPASDPVRDGIEDGMKADEMEHRQRMRRSLLRGPMPGFEPLE